VTVWTPVGFFPPRPSSSEWKADRRHPTGHADPPPLSPSIFTPLTRGTPAFPQIQPHPFRTPLTCPHRLIHPRDIYVTVTFVGLPIPTSSQSPTAFSPGCGGPRQLSTPPLSPPTSSLPQCTYPPSPARLFYLPLAIVALTPFSFVYQCPSTKTTPYVHKSLHTICPYLLLDSSLSAQERASRTRGEISAASHIRNYLCLECPRPTTSRKTSRTLMNAIPTSKACTVQTLREPKSLRAGAYFA